MSGHRRRRSTSSGDADAHPSTTRDRSGTADRDAGAQGDRADGEGHIAQEAGESLCSPAEALTTTGPSGQPQGAQGPYLDRRGLLEPDPAVRSFTEAGSDRRGLLTI